MKLRLAMLIDRHRTFPMSLLNIPKTCDGGWALADGLGEKLDIDWLVALAAAKDAAIEAGNILRRMLDRVQVREKAANDLVTDADLAAQSAIETILTGRFPSHDFLGEEGPKSSEASSNAWQWVVDPLDGTTNYAHGLRGFCVSIALMYHRRPVLGVILDPMAGELFFAMLGKGAFLDDIPSNGTRGRLISPANCENLGKALVAVSLPPKLNRQSAQIRYFLEILLHAQSVRRLGSAALNLCYVASGRLDAYVGSKLNVWDVAAGALIAEEAGVQLARFDGRPLDPWQGEVAAAANSPLLKELIGKITLSE